MESAADVPPSPRPASGKPRLLSWIAWGIYAACSVATGLAMLGRLSAYGVSGETPMLALALLAAACLILILPLCLGCILRRADRLALPAIAGLVAMLVVVAPRYKVAGGSDQGDCVIVAAARLGAGLWPYDAASLWSNNPLSCGPGWVLLHMPFLAVLSYPMAMLALIGASFAAIAAYAGRRRAARFMVLLALIPGFWQAVGNRVDFPTFALVLAALVTVRQASPAASRTVRALAAFTALLTSHFRLPFLFIPAILFSGRTRGAFWCAALVQAASLALWFAFYFYNAEAFVREGPMHVVSKSTLPLAPQSALALVVLGAGLLLAVANRLKSRIPLDHLLLLYISAVIIPISVQNLLAAAGRHDSLVGVLQAWEGLSWLTGTAAFAAWVLAGERLPAWHWLGLGRIRDRAAASQPARRIFRSAGPAGLPSGRAAVVPPRHGAGLTLWPIPSGQPPARKP